MLPPRFLYHDSDVFAVYKPAGVHSVRLASGGGESIADGLLQANPELAQASRNPGDAGLIQRLDHDTSGAILGADNRETWDALFEALQAGQIEKHYVALVEGEIARPITLNSFIGSPYRGAQKVRVFATKPPRTDRALPAFTTISPLQYFPELDVTLVEASAPTARRHQIRAHCASCGHPLLGDTLYRATRSLEGLCVTPRKFFLHSWRLRVAHPKTKNIITIISDYRSELRLSK